MLIIKTICKLYNKKVYKTLHFQVFVLLLDVFKQLCLLDQNINCNVILPDRVIKFRLKSLFVHDEQ